MVTLATGCPLGRRLVLHTGRDEFDSHTVHRVRCSTRLHDFGFNTSSHYFADSFMFRFSLEVRGDGVPSTLLRCPSRKGRVCSIHIASAKEDASETTWFSRLTT